jgi:uncharacterized protein (TIGR00369 family)
MRNKHTVFETLGIRIDSYDPDAFTVSLEVDHRHLQHAGIVHGGIYVLLSESAASIAGAMKTDINEYNVFGMEINANHIRPVSKGRISAMAKPVYIGKQTMVYATEIRDEAGELVSIGRCTLAIRKK